MWMKSIYLTITSSMCYRIRPLVVGIRWNGKEFPSVTARFVLVGSGNPEEGELRPQLLDRFGMHAEIHTVKEPPLRVKIVEQRAEFDGNPLSFLEKYNLEQEELQRKLVEAQNLLPSVELDYDLRVKISEVCSELDVDGLRRRYCYQSLPLKLLAALEGRTTVTVDEYPSGNCSLFTSPFAERIP
jgi:magnesium chelatase subunit I